MSRIHDAMQKAAQERATTEVASFPFETKSVASRESNDVIPPAFISSLTREDVLPPIPGGPLQFEDLQKHCAYSDWHPSATSTLFSEPALNTVGAEQFRTLRSRLYQLRSSRPLKTILVTSAVSGEGKTFVASNLAQAIVNQRDRRVLIIDADLRSPQLHLVFGAASSPGLSDYLRGDIDEVTAIHSEPESSLYFIPSGTTITNPSELLLNGRFKQLLERLAVLFDWIIIDSPPCLPVSDAHVVADSCDALVLVVKAGSTPAEIAQRARHELGNRNVIGVVLNAVNEKALAYGSYYTYAGHGNGTAKESTIGDSR